MMSVLPTAPLKNRPKAPLFRVTNPEPAQIFLNTRLRFLKFEVDVPVTHDIHRIDHRLRDGTGHDHFGKPLRHQIKGIKLGLSNVVFIATISMGSFMLNLFNTRYAKEQIGTDPMPFEGE